MSFRTRRVLIATPLFMVFNFFLLKYLFILFGGLNDWYTLLIVVGIAILQSVPMLFEEKKSRWFTRFLSEIYGIWVWMSLMLLIDIVFIYVLNCFVNLPRAVIIVLLAIVPLLAVYNYYHAHKIIIKEKILKLDDLESDLNIVHLSDVHYGSVYNKRTLTKLADKLKKLDSTCDLVIIAGDLADGSSNINEDDFLPLKEVKMPIIFTPGNHDFYPGIENVYNACRKADIIVLDNEKMNFNGLNIFGFTYSFSEIPPVDSKVLYDTVNAEGISLIIYHPPENWEEFSKFGFNIQLSGHSHGGQFYPIVFFADKLFKYNRGLFKRNIGDKTSYLHVTTGVGGMDYPMRWGTDSELVILKLRKTK